MPSLSTSIIAGDAGHVAAHNTAHALLDNVQTTVSGTSYTAVLSDAGKVIDTTNASAVTFTVPPSASVAWATGDTLVVRQWGAGQVTIAPGSGVTLRSRGAALKSAGQYAWVTLMYRGSNEWALTGDVTT